MDGTMTTKSESGNATWNDAGHMTLAIHPRPTNNASIKTADSAAAR